MNKKVKTLDNLRDSWIMFDKQPPAFGYMIIILVGIFCVAAVIWSMKTPKIYTIQAQGIVTNIDSNYVMCTYTGEIEDCSLVEGALVQEGDVLFAVKSTDYDLQEEQLIANKKIYEQKIEKYELLVKSIKEDVNYFDSKNPEDELYYSTYEMYKAQIAQNILDMNAYKSYGYSNEQIESELIKNQGKISEIYYSALQAAENAIAEAEQQITSLASQLATVQNGRNTYEVRATSTGVLHLMANYKNGMVVQTTTTVATITPENSKRVIETYVSTEDMARIHRGDKVQIVVEGLSQNVYGTINGTVMQIDSNVTLREGTESGSLQVFRVLIEMDNDYLISRKGEKVDIVNGMTAIARIQYDEVTYFYYVLDKLGFRTK